MSEKTTNCADCGVSIVTKKNTHKCSSCGKKLCGNHAFIRVDSSNEFITKFSGEYCKKCYIGKWGKYD